jgi:hypothetical protein
MIIPIDRSSEKHMDDEFIRVYRMILAIGQLWSLVRRRGARG